MEFRSNAYFKGRKSRNFKNFGAKIKEILAKILRGPISNL